MTGIEDEFSTWIEKFEKKLLPNYSSSRVVRGLEYFQKGRIKRVFISPGRISAAVTGRNRSSYDVTITASTQVKTRLTRNIQPLFATAGIPKIEKYNDLVDFIRNGNTRYIGAILPDVSSFRSSCSCPDHASICKHIYAVFFGFLHLIQEHADSALLFAGIDDATFRDILQASSLKDINDSNSPVIYENSGTPVDLDSIIEDIRAGRDFFGLPVYPDTPSPVDTEKLKAPIFIINNDIFAGYNDWISGDLVRGYSIVAEKASSILNEIGRN